MATVFAKCTVMQLPNDFHDIHISCGEHYDDQSDAFTLDDDGSILTVRKLASSGWEITYTAPSNGLEAHPGYWLSPCLLNEEGTEAYDFGIAQDA